jgi:hypothetical protein
MAHAAAAACRPFPSLCEDTMAHPIPKPRRRSAMSGAAPLPLLLALLAFTAHGQPAPTAKPPAAVPLSKADPLDPQARVPALRYESSLKSSKAAGDDKPVSWRDANDNVTRIGGWRVYLREAQLPEPATPTPSTLTPSTPTPVPPPAAPGASAVEKSAAPTAPKPTHGPHHGHPQR